MAHRDWSEQEVEATVESYFEMLRLELRDEPFTKAEFRRRLQGVLDERSEGAIEYKYANVSAVLLDELKFPYVDGYKPRRNYQDLLAEVVANRLRESRDLHALAAAAVSDAEELPVPSVEDFLRVLADPPSPSEPGGAPRGRERGRTRYGGTVDYLKREARNAALGMAGERFVLNFETARLHHQGTPDLADQIEHVSQTQGDAAGYDILSFDRSGRERFIEVKTTRFGKETPFYVSRNQVAFSAEEGERFHLYRVFRFRSDPRMYARSGPLPDGFDLEPVEFLSRAI